MDPNPTETLENENADEVIETNENVENLSSEEPENPGGFYLEPIIFFIGFSGSLIDTILSDVIQAQYCTAVLGRSQSDCQLFNKPKVMLPIPEKDIETFTTRFLIACTLIEAGLPSLTAFFMGPWSDKFGRKPLILAAAFGNFIRCALYMAVNNYPTLNPWYYLVCSIPFGIFGGNAYLLLGTYCYISDISTDDRTTRFVIMQCVFVLGNLMGILCAPYVTSFGAFAIATAVTFGAYCSTQQILPESIHQPTITNLDGVSPWSFKHIRALKDVCYSQQTLKNRFRILVTISILCIALIAEWGDDAILFLFLKAKLNIDLPTFTSFVTYILCIGIIEALFVNHMFTIKMEVATINFLAFAIFMKLIGVFSTLVGYRLWHFCFVRTLNGFIYLITALGRSYLSTLVPQEHLGKIFGILVPVECFTQVFASPFYVEIFNSTTARLPEAVFILSSLFMLSDLLLVILLAALSERPEASPGTGSTVSL